MREVIKRLEEVELDLVDLYRDMVRLQEKGFAERVSELRYEVYRLIIDLEDKS